MNWAWAASLDHLWRSPNLPTLLMLAAAGLFGIIALIALVRAEKSVANVALTVITLLAIGTAVAASSGGFGSAGRSGSGEIRSASPAGAALPALSCLDDLAGETVLAACEKVLFGSAESAAAAVSHAASQLTRLTASATDSSNTSEMQMLRRAVERDRYGLMAYVLVARDRCTVSNCAAFQALKDRQHIVSNMDEKIYEGLISRHAPSWDAPAVPAAAGPVAAWTPSMPSGKPTTAEFPTAASTPAVSIMTPEPGQPGAPPAPRQPPPSQQQANSPFPAPRPAAASSATAAAPAAAPALAAAKKPPAPPKQPRAAPPVQLAPAAANSSTASAPAAAE